MNTKRKIGALAFAFIILLVFIYSCVKIEPVSIIPEIKLISFEVVDGYDSILGNTVKLAQLKFSFIDGDADIGVPIDVKSDISAPDSIKYNLVTTVFDKVDGAYFHKVYLNPVEQRLDTLVINQTIEQDQKLDRVGQNKTVKGEITTTIQMISAEYFKDTFRLEFYIRDRALNKSNIEYTDDYFIMQY